MKTRMMAMILACCPAMTAQITNYLGPGILTRGAGTLGTRAGQDVSLRFFANATGIYDSGIQPYSTDGSGNLVTVNGLWGTQVSMGAYGVHNFRHSRLGLDYQGSYRHYIQNTFFNGTNQSLALGYTHQKSRRLVFDLRQIAGTVSQSTTSFAGTLPAVTDGIITPSSFLFDNRADFLQSTLDMNYLKSARTTFTLGGEGFRMWRKAKGLIGMQGYRLRGSAQRRLSERTTLGVNYEYSHFDFPKAFGESDIHSFSGNWATQLGRSWTVSVSGGAYQAEVVGLQRVAVDPEIAALLGGFPAVEVFYQKSIFPQWGVSLGRRFQRASLTFGYRSGVGSGNGVYLTSRMESGSAAFSYTATRKWSFSANGTYSKMDGIGQNLKPFSQFMGGAGATWAVTGPIHVIARYDARHQEITAATFRNTGYRITFGISFSPAEIPLAFH